MKKRKQKKYTELQKQEVLSSIRHGLRTVSQAASFFDIPRSTVDSWIKNAEAGSKSKRNKDKIFYETEKGGFAEQPKNWQQFVLELFVISAAVGMAILAFVGVFSGAIFK